MTGMCSELCLTFSVTVSTITVNTRVPKVQFPNICEDKSLSERLQPFTSPPLSPNMDVQSMTYGHCTSAQGCGD